MGMGTGLLRVMREMPATARLGKASAGPPAPAATAAASFTSFVAKPQAPVRAAAAPAVTWGAAPEPVWSRIVEHFEIAASPREAWRLLGDIPRLARAMPGAELATSDGATLAGRMHVAFGPMKASFAGTATLARDDAAMTGTLQGGGSDARGGSLGKGRVVYRVLAPAEGSAARVELLFDYQLQGPLAQFARAGLVKDFAARLIADFARNLEAGLAPGAGGTAAPAAVAPPAAPVKAGALLWAVLWARLKRLFGRPS